MVDFILGILVSFVINIFQSEEHVQDKNINTN